MQILGKLTVGLVFSVAAGFAGGYDAATECEDIAVTDPDQLAEMGFARDADNVFERICDVQDDEDADDGRVASSGGFGPSDNYSTWTGRRFQGRDGTYQKRIDNDRGVYCFGGGTFSSETAEQEFQLPNGALITGVRWWAYDGTNADDVVLRIWRFCRPDFGAGNPVYTNLTPGGDRSTGVAFNSGQFSQFFSLSETFDATSCNYIVQTITDTCTSNLATGKVRVQWQRQISPAPASATFLDVPTGHLFFRSIEALAESGITGGCGSGNYCPDSPVTRGQMAAFLSRALGLHWSNP